jgi:hypothetical protein
VVLPKLIDRLLQDNGLTTQQASLLLRKAITSLVRDAMKNEGFSETKTARVLNRMNTGYPKGPKGSQATKRVRPRRSALEQRKSPGRPRTRPRLEKE